ncbi:uncharacterized protein RHTO_01288 [Rhodotorula toruloides NP11]|uniref:Uncharacterized protein n=1 Tax=Rhodotorula toruloides (strain NP11) TaxID=1130832 RepID=M7XPD2_RHOT1|nr:uncharacterized protein RHTO_01288 [Rhodotorula toruloides NP11]EMS22073.1 hypothetical protein RHTO_01288 [Rhodotorula toruloides NP11]
MLDRCDARRREQRLDLRKSASDPRARPARWLRPLRTLHRLVPTRPRGSLGKVRRTSRPADTRTKPNEPT